MKRKTPKKPSGLISTMIKGFAVFFIALLIISSVTKNRTVQDGLFYLVMDIFILGAYKKFLAVKLEDNTLINKIIKSVGIFFLGLMLMGGITNLVTNKVLSSLLGWIWLIGTVYLIYVVFKGVILGGDAKGIKPSSNDGEGIIFGKKGSTVYSMPETEDGHVIVIGGQGTAKTQSISLPTLFTWNGAAIVVDIKGELHGFTGAYREKVMGSKVYVFDPDSADCDCYDPLEQIKGIDGATELARNIIPTPLTGDKFWSECAQGVFASAILDGINKNQAFGDICERVLITEPNQLIQELFNSEDNRVKLLCSAANGIAENTLTGVFSTLRTYILTFASDEKIRNATRKTSWTPAVLEEGATIYLRIHESMLGQYKGLIASIISQTFRYLTKRKDKQQPAILMLLDELPRLGKVEGLVEGMGTLRSRNVHIVPIVQSLSDLDRHYGKEIRKIIIDNTSYKVILGVGELETQKYFSELAGTEKVWQKSYNTNGLLGMKKGHTDSLVEEKIIKHKRFGQLGLDKKSIIFGFKEPIEVDKLLAYKTSKYKKLMDTYGV
ncbi:type IV secretory system conjugative DNA transfer family protein [Candidatus Clostridium radicumherbarum]|uniref:Type IV secretory system conjugative DNA transfer family protein n=1 Tax=Candidatus Clostridium radicumherbarum TaxID=3381662 RepID=A0ABW8TU64_9CLOT